MQNGGSYGAYEPQTCTLHLFPSCTNSFVSACTRLHVYVCVYLYVHAYMKRAEVNNCIYFVTIAFVSLTIAFVTTLLFLITPYCLRDTVSH